MFDYEALFINGDLIEPSSSATIDVISASTEQRIGRVPRAAFTDVDRAVAAARAAYQGPDGWANRPHAFRADVIERLANALEARIGQTASRVAAQMGMPITLAHELEGHLPTIILRYFADLLRQTPPEETRVGLLGGRMRVRRAAVGVVAAVTPWNFPTLVTSMKLGAALAAGCTVVLKPSPQTVLDSYIFAEAATEAGVPPGVINIVFGEQEVGTYLVSHPGVDMISFTGSTAAGREIASVCGSMLRPTVLELGGKSAAIILDDADIDSTVSELFRVCLLNNGQSCAASSRILVPRTRYDEVVDAIATMLDLLPIGDPMDPATQVGPVGSAAHRQRVEGFIARGCADGARLVTGGGRPRGLNRGWFIEPALFADVEPSSELAQAEIFGPVLSVIGYSDEEEAVEIANGTQYGLAGTIWTADEARGERLSHRIESGTIGINYYVLDPGGPFGGIKASGFGRELGPEGLAAYWSIRTTHLAGA